MGQVVLVTSSTDIADLLRREREARGVTGEVFDDRIGWPDRYTAKVENHALRWGKTIIKMRPHADLWLEGLGLALVVMERAEALQRAAATVGGGVREVVPVMRQVLTFN